MRFLTVPLLLLSLVGTAAKLLAQDAPQSFAIKDIKTTGDACPAGSTSLNISDDREAFSLTFSAFAAELGPDILPRERTKRCQLVFDTEQDAQWEYAVLSVYARGYVFLDEGVKGEQTFVFGQKARAPRETVQSLQGPLDQDYGFSYAIPLQDLQWSGCRANARDRVKDFTLGSIIKLRSPGQKRNGFFTVDSIDGQRDSAEQTYELIWRQCGVKREQHIGSCSLTGANGRILMTKASARKPEQAIQKARKKLEQRCRKVGRGFAVCQASQASCTSGQLR